MMQAPVWKIAAAFLLDLLLLGLVVAAQFEELLSEAPHRVSGRLGRAAEASAAAVMLLMMAYFVIFDWLLGQTVGKIVASIRVVGERGKPAFWQCLARNLMFVPLFPFPLLWILDPLFLLFSADRRRLSDRMSRTVEVVA